MKKPLVTLFALPALVAATPPALAHGMSQADQARAATGGFLDFFPLGAMHMLTGYDHLLFLFGVVFFLTRFKDILKFITAFTVGHSITLIGATFPPENRSPMKIAPSDSVREEGEECAPGCLDDWVGDGSCGDDCNVAACGFDNGDCV